MGYRKFLSLLSAEFQSSTWSWKFHNKSVCVLLLAPTGALVVTPLLAPTGALVVTPLISSDRSSCSHPLTTFSHNLLTLFKISLKHPPAPQKGSFRPAKSVTNDLISANQVNSTQLIDADWYADWSWLMLIDADWCWLILIDADGCWLMLINGDWWLNKVQPGFLLSERISGASSVIFLSIASCLASENMKFVTTWHWIWICIFS